MFFFYVIAIDLALRMKIHSLQYRKGMSPIMERHNCLMIFYFLIRGAFLIIFVVCTIIFGALVFYNWCQWPYTRLFIQGTWYFSLLNQVCNPLNSLLTPLYSVRLPLYSVLRSILALQLSLYLVAGFPCSVLFP